MIKIAFIPIDNRCVCTQLAQQICNTDKNCRLLMPDKNLLGDLTKNANADEILNWLESLHEVDIAVISLDTIAYGGLISSRRSSDDIKVIKERINRLVFILKKLKSKVYAFSSIMRISNNNINEEEKEYWNKYGIKIFQYSYNSHKNEKEGKNDKINKDIPEEILNDYIKTRNRNFEINKYYIELQKQGIFNTLVFSKDDCAIYGINVKEAEILKELAKNEKNVYIKTGADEIPLSLLSRGLNKNKGIKIAPVYINPESVDKISKYEDISVKECVNSQIELAGAKVTLKENADIIMLINNFEKEQGDLVMNIDVPLFNKELKIEDKPYFIVDIVNANGSDNNFVKEFLKQKELKKFLGYAAWNTTSNTLGSALCMAMTYFKSKAPDNDNFLKLVITRFLDDWAYQANVRKQIRDNIQNLTNNIVEEKMKPYEKLLFDKFKVKNLKTKYSFPWKRFFEIEINLIDI